MRNDGRGVLTLGECSRLRVLPTSIFKRQNILLIISQDTIMQPPGSGLNKLKNAHILRAEAHMCDEGKNIKLR